jgi:PKD repeat protein
LKVTAIIAFLLLCFATASCKKEIPAALSVANFYAEGNGCVSPCYLLFFDQSENSTSWEWDFGNGKSSILRNDSCLYDNTGTYEVWLYTKNVDLVKDSVRKYVHVN